MSAETGVALPLAQVPVRGDGGEPVIGLALGSGAARGWAHLGVLQALAREGVVPQIICGCSIGAFVGAAAASGDLDKLAQWAKKLKWQDVVSLLDVSLRSGLIKGDKLIDFFERNFIDRDFSELETRFACVATELTTGREIWLQEGSVSAAVRASIAVPGLMTPVVHNGRLLVDGGLVNPVPVSLCRAMGADIVIAVDVGADMVARMPRSRQAEAHPPEEVEAGWTERVLARFGFGNNGRELAAPPAASPSLCRCRMRCSHCRAGRAVSASMSGGAMSPAKAAGAAASWARSALAGAGRTMAVCGDGGGAAIAGAGGAGGATSRARSWPTFAAAAFATREPVTVISSRTSAASSSAA